MAAPNPPPGVAAHAAPAAFPPTRQTVIERMRTGVPDAQRGAFGTLVEGYWRPVYTYIRLRWRLSPEDAEDATQAFFADAFEKGWLDRYDPDRARFRTFIRVCVDRLLQHRA
jgi:DNA-directed RNA polymerase specialized sigma24 family protein